MIYYIFKDGKKRDIPIGKLVCLARTYRKHAEEMKSEIPKTPLLFLKPSTSVIFNGGTIVKPEMSDCIHHEVELGVVIGKRCKNVSKNESLDYVLGYALCLDITARDIQSEFKKKGWPWGIAKCFDTFAPISDVVMKEEVLDPNNLNILLRVNGKLKQNSNTKNMIFSVEQIIEFISRIMTLVPGDFLMTGTPEGVGKIKKGDIIEAKLEDICNLQVEVN
jgi:2-keto-4-pentenoate hydratase/2-oxohepta-3-ene-1,7-dioic acid hydratase in catechol pathway